MGLTKEHEQKYTIPNHLQVKISSYYILKKKKKSNGNSSTIKGNVCIPIVYQKAKDVNYAM